MYVEKDPWMQFKPPIKVRLKVKKSTDIYKLVEPREKNTIDIDCPFIPTWDATDHLAFACGRCGTIANINKVNFDPDHSKDVKYVLYIFMTCPKCGGHNYRKIFLDYDMERPALFHYTAFVEGKITHYGTDREPFDPNLEVHK